MLPLCLQLNKLLSNNNQKQVNLKGIWHFSAERSPPSWTQVVLSPLVLFTATRRSGPSPCYELCLLSKNVAGALSLPPPLSSALCFALRNRGGDWQSKIDGETDREEAEVSLHLCDSMWLSHPVNSFSGWPHQTATREDRRRSVSVFIYHQPWPVRLWNFRDSLNGMAELQSGARSSPGY